MNTKRVYLAADLGAESGRVVAGCFDGERLVLEEVHRFSNAPVKVLGSLRWDILNLFAEVKRGLAAASRSYGSSLVSAGVDTWGVDYGLIAKGGDLLGNPVHYRDSRTDGMMDEAFRRLPKREMYKCTGIQFMFFNTAYQLLSEVVHASPALALADKLLFVPDLLNYWLTGQKVNERTITSTSQIYDPKCRQWSRDVIEKMGFPGNIFGEIVSPGTVLGPLLPEIAAETGVSLLKVVAPGCHDTASAVAAVPAQGASHAYLSSGTWSLMGIESPRPVINDKSLEIGFTNEIGACDTVRVLKNISGLWLVQESRRTWASQGRELSYDDLARLAESAQPFTALVNPDHASFAAPGDMPARIRDLCARTGQRVPVSEGEIIRTALESLALKYRWVLMNLEELVGHRLEVLHIVGGGTKNRVLSQFTANSINRPVIAGPVEATSAGNILLQMMGMGDLRSLYEGRELIARSFETETFLPVNPSAWDQAYEEFVPIAQA
ncbi:MAG TPA: rhamnulokinase family protein [Acidobacteriota bacterium]|nr:rhamnulokinase family protein [Acidobacteriota bacterium]